MKKFDLSFYLILDPDLCGGTSGIIDTARAALREGATFLQLRAPKWKKREMVECTRALMPIAREFGVPLVIDDHVDVALAGGADGVHVGQKDIDASDARRILGPDAIIGLSIGSLEECATYDKEIVDYAGVGPVFGTRTKLDASPEIGCSMLSAVIQRLQAPVVAIGGINPSNASMPIKAGADGVCVISAVCGQPDAAQAARSLRAAIDAARSELKQ